MLSSLFILLKNALGPSSASVVWPTHVKRLEIAGDILSAELTLASRLVAGDDVLCVDGDIVPRDGDVVAGEAIVSDVHARDAAPAPCRSVSAGARIKAGTRVLANYVIVRVGARGPRFA